MSDKGNFKPDYSPGPPTMVYKTKKDYSKNVPVLLSEDKLTVTSYPAPSDIKDGAGKYPFPTVLKNGYLLDNRGINANVAFLNMTYEDYAKLSEAPHPKDLKEMIIDSDPLTELCDCGNRHAFKNAEKQINGMIKKGTLRTTCMKLK